jgi:hypothetical protein
MARTLLVQTIAVPIEFARAVTCYRDAHDSERLLYDARDSAHSISARIQEHLARL